MNTRPSLVLTSVTAAALSIGSSGAATASTDPTEPSGWEPTHTEHTMDTTAGTLAVDGSAEATSPEAEAFCAAEIAVEAALATEDPTAIGPALEALTAVTPADLLPAVEVAANPEMFDSPEFAEAYAEVIDWMKANCGYVLVDVSASDYAFEGLPSDLPAGGTIFTLENVGEQAHEIAVQRINDDVTLSVEELLALPEEEAMASVTPAAFAFTFPGTSSYATGDLAPGRYVVLCFLPEGATPEVLMQLEELGVDGPEDTTPADAGIELGPPHYALGMVHEFTVV